jgi:adenine-specific DNA-methyltransferase
LVKRPKINKKEDVVQYTHSDETRANIPPAGLVTAETDPLDGKKTYKFDPHLDPELQWAGKTEGVSFDVDTVSLHVHERIDPLTIIEAVRKKELENQKSLFHYFESSENNLPIREAIEFYKHSEGWSNRLIAGDSLLVMNSLLEKEAMANKVQMIYIDPPYGIRYGSNFQPFVNKREVKDGKDEDLTQEPETIKAFRDTWELGIHSYLTYLRNRLLLTRALLSDSGSVFVQISDENIHHVKELMDEIFGANNFVSIITFKKAGGQASNLLSGISDYLIWYGKDKAKIKYHQLFKPKILSEDSGDRYTELELLNGEVRPLSKEEKLYPNMIPKGAKPFLGGPLLSEGASSNPWTFEFKGKKYSATANKHWKISKEGMQRLVSVGRIFATKTFVNYKQYLDDFPFIPITNLWDDTMGTAERDKKYVVQTAQKVIERCILMTTDPGDLVLDPTCGSGTTAHVAEQWGRRWITCDTSRVSITLTKQRIMTLLFDYYELAHLSEGISSGFKYETAFHIMLGSVANNEPPQKETLYDKPLIDKIKKRVAGPFTLEAVPSQQVRSISKTHVDSVGQADNTIARSGESIRLYDWIAEISKTGIRGSSGQIIQFIRIEPIAGTKWIHAKAETKDNQHAIISFGPDYAPLEQRQVELAIEEAQTLVPKPKFVIFASFQFDPEAAKDIDQLNWQGVKVLKCQMNTDLLTLDLKKNKSSNESFWLIGQPDVDVKADKDKYIVTINGFDYYNTKTGEIESGDTSKIAMWELDTDYDGRSLYPRQVFFPMASDSEGWNKLAKILNAYIDEDLIENYKGNKSIPFKPGKNKQIAVKIIDDRGIESLRVIKVD